MKRLFFTTLLASMFFTSGCNNPISASVEKEGDKTRADMIAELNAAKVDIYNAFKKEIAQSSQNNIDAINAYVQYLMSVINTRNY